jgi:hypothetical protein
LSWHTGVGLTAGKLRPKASRKPRPLRPPRLIAPDPPNRHRSTCLAPQCRTSRAEPNENAYADLARFLRPVAAAAFRGRRRPLAAFCERGRPRAGVATDARLTRAVPDPGRRPRRFTSVPLPTHWRASSSEMSRRTGFRRPSGGVSVIVQALPSGISFPLISLITRSTTTRDISTPPIKSPAITIVRAIRMNEKREEPSSSTGIEQPHVFQEMRTPESAHLSLVLATIDRPQDRDIIDEHATRLRIRAERVCRDSRRAPFLDTNRYTVFRPTTPRLPPSPAG